MFITRTVVLFVVTGSAQPLMDKKSLGASSKKQNMNLSHAEHYTGHVGIPCSLLLTFNRSSFSLSRAGFNNECSQNVQTFFFLRSLYNTA